ncbi:MAG: hypothetical protein J0I40_06415 [Cellulomonas sp.]|uniref:LpqB family beta-propeller domain-containing protein n=1 Tax=Cellulomonas sp. 73-92 TaxID=1895740 RepID=UPI000929A5FD|nr:LpqB family beta-propeller domain-containing protein [Cellulomonas sp. 73-92]MBN9375013.1 hypothetical protein [Cellulomonas sp.]OJV82097.1 MAG: hypothetical protein BGO37_03585 [Cellulomonas sp. 73-92]
MSRALRVAGLLAVAAVALGACARIPTSGPVQQGGGGQVAEPNPAVVLAVGPQPGSQPEQIVEDYLTAGAAGVSNGLDFTVARKYLYGDAAANWNPLGGVLVVDGFTPSQPSDTQVTIDASVVAKVDADGVYSETARGAPETVTFGMVQDTSGQWRIKDVPDGLILTSRQFQDQFRRVSLFFLTPDAQYLVPDPRWYPAVNLATSVVKGLLAGPAPLLRDAVRTAVPQGVVLTPEAVTVKDGQAEVDLGPASAVQAADHDLLVAQIQETLVQQVAQVRTVVVQAGADGPQLQGTKQLLTIGQAQATPAAAEAIASDANGEHLAALGSPGTPPVPVAGVAPLTGLDARSPARSENGVVRVFLRGPNELATVPTASQASQTLLQSPNLAAPSVDRFGWVWTASGGTVSAVDGHDPDVSLTPKWLADRTVTAVRVSRDGTRIAVVSTAQDGSGVSIDVAGIARDERGGPQQLSDQTQRVGAALTVAGSVVWYDDDQLAVLARGAGSATVWEVPLGGPSKALPDVAGGVSLAGWRTERSLLVATSDGRLLTFSGPTWTPVEGVSGVRDPSYPG